MFPGPIPFLDWSRDSITLAATLNGGVKMNTAYKGHLHNEADCSSMRTTDLYFSYY